MGALSLGLPEGALGVVRLSRASGLGVRRRPRHPLRALRRGGRVKRKFLGDRASDQYARMNGPDDFVRYVRKDPEQVRKIRNVELAVMTALKEAHPEGTCLDAFLVFVRLAGVMAKMGHLDDEHRRQNPLASQEKIGLSLEEFLQNCRNAYENCKPRAGGST